MFFVDQPVGVGFSYADYGESVVSRMLFSVARETGLTSAEQGTTMEAADDIAAFIAIFFEHFSSFKGRPLHLAGESYGVRSPRSRTWRIEFT